MFTVYMATNKINGKRYIGVTSLGMIARKTTHLANARAGHPERFYVAIRKHYAKNFIWTVLCTRKGKADAYRREWAYVDALTPEYNMIPGGKPPPMAGQNKIPVMCLEDGLVFESARRAAENYSADFSEICKAIRGDVRAVKDLHFVEASVLLSPDERMSLCAKIDADFILRRRRVEIRKLDDVKYTNRRGRTVRCIDDGEMFSSVRSAARFYNVDASAINELCNGKRFRKAVAGRRFEFVGIN